MDFRIFRADSDTTVGPLKILDFFFWAFLLCLIVTAEREGRKGKERGRHAAKGLARSRVRASAVKNPFQAIPEISLDFFCKF